MAHVGEGNEAVTVGFVRRVNTALGGRQVARILIELQPRGRLWARTTFWSKSTRYIFGEELVCAIIQLHIQRSKFNIVLVHGLWCALCRGEDMVLARGDFSSACSENVLNEVCEKPVHMMCERDACVLCLDFGMTSRKAVPF